MAESLLHLPSFAKLARFWARSRQHKADLASRSNGFQGGNLTPQETTTQDAPDVGADGGSSVLSW